MPFAYYNRLTAAQKRIYRTSDAIESIALHAGTSEGDDVAVVRAGLATDDRALVQSACQRIVDALTDGYRVPPIRMRVLAQRHSSYY